MAPARDPGLLTAQVLRRLAPGWLRRGMARMEPVPRSLLVRARERAELASLLMESLEDKWDAAVQEEWAREIERRVAEVKSGEVETIPWSQVRRELLDLAHGR